MRRARRRRATAALPPAYGAKPGRMRTGSLRLRTVAQSFCRRRKKRGRHMRPLRLPLVSQHNLRCSLRSCSPLTYQRCCRSRASLALPSLPTFAGTYITLSEPAIQRADGRLTYRLLTVLSISCFYLYLDAIPVQTLLDRCWRSKWIVRASAPRYGAWPVKNIAILLSPR